jgi:hypothetical protein
MRKWQKYGRGKQRGRAHWRGGKTKLEPPEISQGVGKKYEWVI